MKQIGREYKWVFFLCLYGLLMGCNSPIDPESKSGTPRPIPTTQGSSLSIHIPDFQQTISTGKSLAGIPIRYEGATSINGEYLYQFTLQEETLQRKVGEALPWVGMVAPWVHANYQVNIASTQGKDVVRLAGSATFTVMNPEPVSDAFPICEENDVCAIHIPYNHIIPLGRDFPASALHYTAKNEDDTVTISGTPKKSYTVGDRITWEGRANGHTYIRIDTHLIEIEEHGLRVSGSMDFIVKR